MPLTPDPIHLAMGLERGELASEVLRRQSHLIDAQAREIHFNHLWHVILRGIAAVLTGFLLLGFIAMVWEAANDESLVIDAFTAPPEFTARGLSGEVIAAKLQDELNLLDRETVTIRASRTYANNWEGDIRVEVPEAKISLGELRRTLHKWLGDATHISGSAYLEAGQARLEARVNGKSYSAASSDGAINPLIRQLALAVFGDTQPHRYGVKLFREGRAPEAFAIMEKLEKGADQDDRFWGLTFFARNLNDLARQHAYAQKSANEFKEWAFGWSLLAEIEIALGHPEAAILPNRKVGALVNTRRSLKLSEDGRRQLRDESGIINAFLFADFATAVPIAATLASNPVRPSNAVIWPPSIPDIEVLAHRAAVTDTAGFLSIANAPENRLFVVRSNVALHALAAQQTANWAGIAEQADGIRGLPQWSGNLMPLLAEAYAHLGEHAEADAIIAALPADHYERWRTCGRIAAFRQDWTAGERCFREAIRQAPSIPRGYLDYGTMLAAKGDLAGATRQLALAHEKGPKWADPLKAWGDVLLRQGRKDDAREKYQSALEHAPAWPELKASLRQLGS